MAVEKLKGWTDRGTVRGKVGTMRHAPAPKSACMQGRVPLMAATCSGV